MKAIQKTKSTRLDALTKEFEEAKSVTSVIQNQSLGVAATPTKEQEFMQKTFDPESTAMLSQSGFYDGYARLIKQTDTNRQAMLDAVAPMQVDVMSHRLGQNAMDDNNRRLHMINSQFGLVARSTKTEKKAKKFRRIDAQMSW